jgi:ribose transport system substrate-binding protein
MREISSKRVARTLLTLAGVAVLAAGCSSSGGNSTGSTGAGNGALADTVKKLSEPLASYPIPTEQLTGVSALKGKTVFYIPITQQAPQFSITGTALKKALGTVGVDVQICNGNSNPSQISGCVTQATSANAGAIITDSIPYALAANAFNAAQAKKIPVLITDQIADPQHPAGATLGYIEGAGKAQLVAIADWIIDDSGGNANVVINESTDSPSTQAYVAAAQDEFKTKCSGCDVTVNKISSANFSLIASSTSSALLKNPNAKYLISEFDQYLQPTLGGAQQSGRMTTLKGVSSAAGVSGLQMLKAKNFLHADASQASAYQGWASADAALRLMLGKQLPDYTIPSRLFTRDNVSSVQLTDAAEATGEWYGPTDYPAKFTALWQAK